MTAPFEYEHKKSKWSINCFFETKAFSFLRVESEGICRYIWDDSVHTHAV